MCAIRVRTEDSHIAPDLFGSIRIVDHTQKIEITIIILVSKRLSVAGHFMYGAEKQSEIAFKSCVDSCSQRRN